MENALYIGTVFCGALASVGYSIAAVKREEWRGKVAMIRALRGDPEPSVHVTTLPSIFRKRT